MTARMNTRITVNYDADAGVVQLRQDYRTGARRTRRRHLLARIAVPPGSLRRVADALHDLADDLEAGRIPSWYRTLPARMEDNA